MLGLAILSSVAIAGLVFMFWVLYHLLLDSGHIATLKKHTIAKISPGTTHAEATPKHARLQ